MQSSASTHWLTRLAEPLAMKFGCDLTLHREGDAVHWAFAGQSAVIELQPDGRLAATFIDRTTTDEVSGRFVAGAYAVAGGYALTPASCGRMIDDMVDFFSGVREPKFRFVDAYAR